MAVDRGCTRHRAPERAEIHRRAITFPEHCMGSRGIRRRRTIGADARVTNYLALVVDSECIRYGIAAQRRQLTNVPVRCPYNRFKLEACGSGGSAIQIKYIGVREPNHLFTVV